MIGLFQGFGYALKGLSLINQKGIRPFIIVPLLVNITLFLGGIWLAFSQLAFWIARLLPDWLIWLEWILWPLFAVVILLAIFYTFSLVANLIAAPFNAILSERVETHLNGLPVPAFAGYKTLPSVMTRTFKSEVSKLLYMAKWALLIIIITFIPVVNLIAPFAWLWFGAWMLAIEYSDYPMGNHELFFQDELIALRKHRLTALSFGGTLSCLMIIPIFNFLVMPIGVAGATAFWVDRISHDYH